MKTRDYYLNEEAILSCPLFTGMTESEVLAILSDKDSRITDYKSGMVIGSDVLYVVLKGCILIEKRSCDGRFITMGRAEPYTAVNAASVFLKSEPMSRLLVQTDARLLQIGEEPLRKGIRNGGAFAINMMEFLTSRISFLNRKITSFAGYSAAGRLQMYLEENNVNGVVTLPMSLTEFAEFLGVGRASLYRTLDQLESEGKIERKGRRIVLTEL